jgi:hypothetical protein
VAAFGVDLFRANIDRLTLVGNFDGTGDQTVLAYNTMGGPDGFLGIIGMAPFSSVVFGNNSTDVDAFSVDNASFASAVSVPEPTTIVLLLAGSLGVLRGKRARHR